MGLKLRQVPAHFQWDSLYLLPNYYSPNQDGVLPTVERTIVSTIVRTIVGTIVSRVTRGDERFVDFVDFIKILFYILFLFIKTINIRLSSNLQTAFTR